MASHRIELVSTPVAGAPPSQGGSPETMAGLQMRVLELQATNAKLAARLASLDIPAEPWVPLKVAAFDCGLNYERARRWAEKGLFEAERDGKRWICNASSLMARKQRLTGSCPQ
jgi:hypothetical protein